MTPLFFVIRRLLFVVCLLSSSLLNFAQQLPDYVWGRAILGGGYINLGYSVIDAPGNVYMAGTFDQWVDFDPSPGAASLSAAAGTDAFVAKYDGAGNYIWAVSFAESDNSTGKVLSVDANANVYVTGNFSGTISFTNSASYTSLGGNDVFISKLNATGGLVWAQRIGGNSLDNATGIVADTTGNVFACGMFESGTIDLDPGPDSANYVAGSSIVYLVN